MKGKDRFTSAEIVELRELIAKRQNATKDRQSQLRSRMRRVKFYGRDDWGIINFKLEDLDKLIETGRIKIIDNLLSTITTGKSKKEKSLINKQITAVKDSNWINRIDFGKIESLKDEGFYGFVSVKSLLNNHSKIPATRGVYMVLRTIMDEPLFLEKGSGGYFKGTDPNVAIKILQEKWVYNTPVLYIGKAGGEEEDVTLRSRILKYLKFGQGKSIGHNASHYSTNNPIVHHKSKCAKKLHTSAIWERVTISIKKVKYNNNKNPSPLIIHSKPRSESGHAKRPKESLYRTTLQKIFKNH